MGLAPSPESLQQLVAGDDPAVLERERVEQAELGGRQLGALAGDVGLHLARVDPHSSTSIASPRDVSWARTPWRAATRTRAVSSFIEKA